MGESVPAKTWAEGLFADYRIVKLCIIAIVTSSKSAFELKDAFHSIGECTCGLYSAQFIRKDARLSGAERSRPWFCPLMDELACSVAEDRADKGSHALSHGGRSKRIQKAAGIVKV